MARARMKVRGLRASDPDWKAALAAAARKGENLPDEFRYWLALYPDMPPRYARTAPARPDAMTGGTPTDTEEPQP